MVAGLEGQVKNLLSEILSHLEVAVKKSLRDDGPGLPRKVWLDG